MTNQTNNTTTTTSASTFKLSLMSWKSTGLYDLSEINTIIEALTSTDRGRIVYGKLSALQFNNGHSVAANASTMIRNDETIADLYEIKHIAKGQNDNGERCGHFVLSKGYAVHLDDQGRASNKIQLEIEKTIGYTITRDFDTGEMTYKFHGQFSDFIQEHLEAAVTKFNGNDVKQMLIDPVIKGFKMMRYGGSGVYVTPTDLEPPKRRFLGLLEDHLGDLLPEFGFDKVVVNEDDARQVKKACKSLLGGLESRMAEALQVVDKLQHQDDYGKREVSSKAITKAFRQISDMQQQIYMYEDLMNMKKDLTESRISYISEMLEKGHARVTQIKEDQKARLSAKQSQPSARKSKMQALQAEKDAALLAQEELQAQLAAMQAQLAALTAQASK